jgi:glycosyltransferase involved in cell wall biosynthesis
VKSGISAVIIALNEAKNLEILLGTLGWCDEIIVLDSGSSDGTVEIAKKSGARVFIEEWKGYGLQKQSAVDKASSAWILSIDADERVSTELKEEILNRTASADAEGYYIPRKNFYGKKWLRFGGQYPDYVLRLFRKSAGRFTPDIVHERVEVEGRTERLKSPIIHYAFDSLASRMDKTDKYATLSALKMKDAGKKASALSPYVHLLSPVLKDYVLRLGFLDGSEGFNVALFKALGAYLKYAKLIELQKADEPKIKV